jgi:hypothetical protein
MMELEACAPKDDEKGQNSDSSAIAIISPDVAGSAAMLRPAQSDRLANLNTLLNDLDPLMIAIGLAFAACAPGPVGEAGAIAAISFDVLHRRWLGVACSAASMIPVIGYLPALFKVGWLFVLLSRRLRTIEAMLPELHGSPECVELLRNWFGRYYRHIPKMKLTHSLRVRMEGIMAVDTSPASAQACDDSATVSLPPKAGG